MALSCLTALATAGQIADVTLPATWRIKLDPADGGQDQKWFAPDRVDEDWQTVSTHKWSGWEKQGLPQHTGYAWYRLTWKVPAALAKKHVYLCFSGVDDEAWVWVNGQPVGEHTQASLNLPPDEEIGGGPVARLFITPFSFDVAKFLRPGAANVFSVRVHNRSGSGGIWKPVHLIACDEPLEKEQLVEHGKDLDRQVLQSRNPRCRYDVWTTYPYQVVRQSDPGPAGSADPALTVTDHNESLARSYASSIHARAACGEYVPIVLHVRNRGKTDVAIRFDFSQVKHETHGLLMRSDRYEIRFVDRILTAMKNIVPDPLPRLDSAGGLRIPSGQTDSFFALINTRGMPAGLWKGQIRLTPLLAGPVLDLPFELRVDPVVLPERMPIWFTMWSYAPSHGWGAEGWSENKPYMDLMRRTGVNVVQMSHRDGFPTPILNADDELVGIDTVRFDQMMARREYTHRDFLVVGINMRKSEALHWGKAEYLGEEWNRNFIAYCRLVATHIRQNHGIPYKQWGLYLVDENIGDDFLEAAKLVRKADPKIRIWANRIEDIKVVQKAEPYMDIVIAYSPWLSSKGIGFGEYPESEKLLKAKGKEWWAYVHAHWRGPERTAIPRAMSNSPHERLRTYPWFAWKTDLDGFGYWVYTAPRWWERYDGYPAVLGRRGPFRNVGLVYMGHGGPIPSRRLEAYRDGMEDYKLLWTMRQAAAVEGQDAQLVLRARANMRSAVDEVLDGATPDTLLGWRNKLLDDAVQLCNAAPLDVTVKGVETTLRNATVTLAASKPVRVWAWLPSSEHWRYVETAEATATPAITIPGLVPGQICDVTLVAAGPQGQQKVLKQKFQMPPWSIR